MNKRWLLLACILIVPVSIWGQEKSYLHELKGFEDVNGKTILFYRHYRTYTEQCDNGSSITNIYNNVYHYNLDMGRDYSQYNESHEPSCEGSFFPSSGVDDYFYVGNDFKLGSFRNRIFIKRESFFDPEFTHINVYFQKLILLEFNPSTMFDSHNGDSLHFTFTDRTITLESNIHNWDIETDRYGNIAMRTLLNYNPKHVRLFQINEQADSIYYAIDNNSLIVSSDTGKTYNKADSFPEITFDRIDKFKISSSGKYAVYINEDKLLTSDNYGLPGSWTAKTLPAYIKGSNGSDFHIETDFANSDRIFVADSLTVWESNDFGAHYSEYASFNSEIQGLYQKPGTDSLFVLTLNALTLLESGEKKDLERVSVNITNDVTGGIPYKTGLLSNYPNPFNPSTNIEYSLSTPQSIVLSVYNIQGKLIKNLYTGFQRGGKHSLTFNAKGLASGIYIVRLRTDDAVYFKRITLIK